LPEKDFQKEWDAKTIELMYNNNNISKTEYDKWEKNPKSNKLGDWHCSWCDWKEQCAQDDLTLATNS